MNLKRCYVCDYGKFRKMRVVGQFMALLTRDDSRMKLVAECAACGAMNQFTPGQVSVHNLFDGACCVEARAT